MLESDSRIQVIDRVRNGQIAVEKVKELNPDVVTLDIEMPVMDGIEALKKIMNESPKPVIMLSSTTKKGRDTTIEAMENGAFDFISKPSGSISLDIHKVKEELIEKVVEAFNTPTKKLTTKHTCKEIIITEDKTNHAKKELAMRNKLASNGIVAIGTSTGGPKALQSVLTELPENFPHPILIVQHMPKGFTKSLSERLNHLSKITVKEAEDGDILKKGVAYIAPGGYHLKVKKLGKATAISLDQTDLINGHRPSVDALFNSLAELPNQQVLAVVLTGMGSDGSKGLVKLKNNLENTIAIAESEETSIVFGMPRSAIATNRVDIVVKLDDIADTIVRHCQ